MKDLFHTKNIKPMLIGKESGPFDSDEYIYELKLDGERCVAYLDKNSTELRSKRNIKMLPKFPELSEIHKCVKKRCILDGELAVIKDGKPDFFEIQRRSLMTNHFRIELASMQYPACFTAFDILYLNDKPVMDLPLLERKRLMSGIIKKENDRFAISRIIENQGTAFYELAKSQELEGIVAKHKESRYYQDKKTKDWIKIKYLQDDDYIVCGYIPKDNHMTSTVLGQYRGKDMVYKGHVTLGVGGEGFKKIRQLPEQPFPPFPVPDGNENAVWVEPLLVCTVKYMSKTKNGGLRQPVFKGLREDKLPEECIEH